MEVGIHRQEVDKSEEATASRRPGKDSYQEGREGEDRRPETS